MDSEFASSPTSSPAPSSHEGSAAVGGESPDPEEYETASDPEVDDTDSSAVAEGTLLPEKNVSTSSSATGDHKGLSFADREVHDSSKHGVLKENSDVVRGVGEKLEEEEMEGKGEEGMLSSVPRNPVGNDDCGGDDIPKSAENGDGESRVEESGSLGWQNEHSNSLGTGISPESEPNERHKGNFRGSEMEYKATESVDGDSSSSLNQNALKEVKPKTLNSESFVAASGEVGDATQEGHATDVEHNESFVNLEDVLPAKGDELDDNRVSAVAPDTVEVEAEPYADRGDKFDSLLPDVNDSKGTDAGHKSEVADEAERRTLKLLDIGATDEAGPEGSNGEVNLMNGKTPKFNSIDSNVEVVAEGLVKNPENINYEPAKDPEIADKKEDVGSEDTSCPSEGTSNIEIANESVVARSEHVAIPAQAEVIVQLTADNVDLNRGSYTENLPQNSASEKIDDMSITEISKNSTPNFENADEKWAIGSEHVSSPGQGKATVLLTEDDADLNSSVGSTTLSVTVKENDVGHDNTHGHSTESAPHIISADKLDVTSMNQEIAEEKMEVGSEDAPSPGEGEPSLQLCADDCVLNSEAEVETPVIEKESVVGVENTGETTTESLSQQSNTNKINVISVDQQSAEDKVVVGSEHISCHSEDESAPQLTTDDGDSNPAVEVETLPIDANETDVRDKSLSEISELELKVEPDAGESQVHASEQVRDVDEDIRTSDGPARVAIFDGPEAAKQIIREMERISSSSQSGSQGSHNYSTNADGQIVSDSDEVLDSDEDGDGGELFDSAALAALLKAATGSSDGTVTVSAQDAARIFSGDRPVGLGASAPSLRPSAPRSSRPSLFTPSEIAAVEEPDRSMDDDEKRLHEKVEQIRVKFLRLVHRLGHSPADAVAGQVLYRLSLAEGIKQGRQMSRAFSIESAKKQALQLEEEGKDDLDFSCNILVLGKTGVGKSATINSIFGEERSQTNPFQLATASVREISGVVDGVRVRVIDTPGLKPSITDQATNRKILSSIKKFTKKCPPDIVLYVDRMDTQTRDFNDLPLLRSITSILGSSIWFNAIVALTHAASAPPDGPNGSPLGYEVFVTQRSHVVQQSVRQAAGDMRLMNPVALVENHPSCRRNREGERILPNGVSWRPQLLLLSYASKILSEANSLLKLQDPSPGKLFGGFRLRSPPLPFLLSSLLQSRAHPKLSGDQGGDNADSDVDLDDFSDAEQDEEVEEYDQLPPFKPLKKSQIAKLTKEQKKAYFDEYDYRVKLLQKKQWREAVRRSKEAKKKGQEDPDEFINGDMPEYYDQDGSPAAVQVPLPDMILPPSFDCDNPAFRYRFLEPTSQLLTRAVLDTHGWDHDCGYDGVSIEERLAIAGRFPTSMAIQITKDKKEFNIHLDSSVAVKHGEHGSTLAGFDIQSVGKQLAYILRGETKFDNLRKNKTAAGISVTFLGETVATGLKIEDRISICKRLGLVASTGAVRAQGDVAYGANLEVRLRDKDYPIGQALSTLGLSLMKWRSDLALGANLQSQFSVGRNSKMAVRVGLNNKLTGQITVRTSTSDHLQIAFAGIIPLAISIYRSIKSNESYMDR